MAKISFQDNFGTNLTSAQIAGVTTTPLDDIPSVDAPYYLAFDATNVNGKFEIVYVTSDTTTNVNHAATTYAHTTAEEVRLVAPSAFLNAIQELEEGCMRNGKISVSVASNNLTAALKTAAGTDPSVTDPVFVKIGGTVRTITSALSLTYNAGENKFNAGSAELATKEIDYFVYFWFSTGTQSGLKIGFSRIPDGKLKSDFSGTPTNEKFIDGAYTDYSNATDPFVNIGRFAATLSAGAGYTWSVPTFTAKNLIQRPIYETRLLTYVPTLAVISGSTTGNYKLVGKSVSVFANVAVTAAGAASVVTITTPFTAGALSDATVYFGNAFWLDTGTAYYTMTATLDESTNTLKWFLQQTSVGNYLLGNQTNLGNTDVISTDIKFEI